MNKEFKNEPRQEQNDIGKEAAELTPEQKKALLYAWGEMVVDDTNLLNDIERLTQKDLKNRLFESVMKDIDKFIKELDLKIDLDLINKIKNNKNPPLRRIFILLFSLSAARHLV